MHHKGHWDKLNVKSFSAIQANSSHSHIFKTNTVNKTLDHQTVTESSSCSNTLREKVTKSSFPREPAQAPYAVRDATEIQKINQKKKKSVLEGSGHSRNGCHKISSVKGCILHPDTNWEDQRPYKCWEEPGSCWISAVEWARLNSTNKLSNWQGHLHLQNHWHCSFFSISFPTLQISAEPQGEELLLQAGRRLSFFHFSFNFKERYLKKTRAFCELLNVATSLGC